MTITISLADGRRIELEGDQFRVGRGAACAVAFPDDSRVQPEHAVLKRVAGRWMIEAQGGELIQVGTELPARMRWLNPGDIVRLTEQGPEFVFQPPIDAEPAAERRVGFAHQPGDPSSSLPDGGGHSPPYSVAVPTVSQQSDASHSVGDPQTISPLMWALGGATVVAVGILVGVIALGVAGAFRSPGEPGPPPGPPAASIPGNQRPTQGLTSSVGLSPHYERSNPENRGAAGASEKTAIDTPRALYLVLVKQPEQGQTFQLGTAWGAAKNQLVTSAAVVVAIEDLRDVVPVAAVSSPVSQQEFKIVQMKVHPAYRQAVADAKTAQKEAESLRLELGEKKTGPEIESLTQKVIAAEERRYLALERQVYFDVGLIEIGEDLAVVLPLAEKSAGRPKTGARIALAGVPFLRDEYLVDPDAPAMPVESPGNILLSQKLAADAAGPFRLVIKFRLDLSGQNWAGSPILNAAGQAVGVYSRPTPPPLDPKAAPNVASHDAADIERLREFAPEVK